MRDESLEHAWKSVKLNNGASWDRCRRCSYYKHPGNVNQDCGEGSSLDDDFLDSLNGLEIESGWGKAFTFCFFLAFAVIIASGFWERKWDRELQERQAKALEVIAFNTRSVGVEFQPDGSAQVRFVK